MNRSILIKWEDVSTSPVNEKWPKEKIIENKIVRNVRQAPLAKTIKRKYPVVQDIGFGHAVPLIEMPTYMIQKVNCVRMAIRNHLTPLSTSCVIHQWPQVWITYWLYIISKKVLDLKRKCLFFIFIYQN